MPPSLRDEASIGNSNGAITVSRQEYDELLLALALEAYQLSRKSSANVTMAPGVQKHVATPWSMVGANAALLKLIRLYCWHCNIRLDSRFMMPVPKMTPRHSLSGESPLSGMYLQDCTWGTDFRSA